MGCCCYSQSCVWASIGAHAKRSASCLTVAFELSFWVKFWGLGAILAPSYGDEAAILYKHTESPKVSVHMNTVFDMTKQQYKDKDVVLPCTLSQLALAFSTWS